MMIYISDINSGFLSLKFRHRLSEIALQKLYARLVQVHGNLDKWLVYVSFDRCSVLKSDDPNMYLPVSAYYKNLIKESIWILAKMLKLPSENQGILGKSGMIMH